MRLPPALAKPCGKVTGFVGHAVACLFAFRCAEEEARNSVPYDGFAASPSPENLLMHALRRSNLESPPPCMSGVRSVWSRGGLSDMLRGHIRVSTEPRTRVAGLRERGAVRGEPRVVSQF